MRHFIANIVALALLATPTLAENSKCRGLPITAETSPRPDFVCPLAETSGIRPQDSHGEGCFASSRGGGARSHNAVDLNTSLGVDVLAARAGEARLATNWDPNGEGKGFGKRVIIEHEDGDYTFYAEVVREHGGRNYLRQKMTLGQQPVSYSIAATAETGVIQINYLIK